jgi:Dolichyl-phosphate-mannose-protein mannosyltransferase/Aminoarabinose transferase C-terminal domain
VSEAADSSERAATVAARFPGAGSNAAPVAIAAALAALVSFFHLWSYGLWEPDEARYAEIAREMVTSGNYLIPHLNYVIYIEKPPLLYWLTALSYHVFGINEFAARFFGAVFAVLGVAATSYFALRSFGRRHALLAGAILATMPIYAVLGQVLTTDMILAALMTIASFALFMHWREGGIWCWLAYLAMALGILTKGPVAAILPVGAMLAFLVWQGELRGAIGRFHAISGAIAVLAIAAPWFIYAIIRVPGYFDFYFVGEYLKRVFQPSYSHGEPIWYYVPVLAGGLLPWSAMVPLMTWRAMAPNPARRYCLVLAIVVVGAFSLASAKLIPYILPALPPIAILIADGIISCAWPETTADREDARRAGLRPPDTRILGESGVLLGLLGAGTVVAAIMAAHFRTPYPYYMRPALYAIGAILLVGGAAASAAFLTRRTGAGLAAVVLAIAAALVAGSWARIEAEPLRSYATLARTIEARAPDATIICYHRYVQSLPFYTRRRVILVGAKTELAFGARHAPDRGEWFFKKDADLMRLWRSPGRKVLVLDAPDLARMRDELGPYTLIASELRKRAILEPREEITRN